jgi:hypothetical protein
VSVAPDGEEAQPESESLDEDGVAVSAGEPVAP